MSLVRRNLIATITTSSTPDPLLLNLAAPSVPVGFFVGLALSNVFLRGSGGAGGYSYSILTGALPTGLALNGATGAITGTPSAQGFFAFTAQVQDAASNVFASSFTMRVQSGLFPLAVNPTPCVRTLAYRYQVLMADATGSTAGISYTIVAGALPAGLAMPASGVIAGAATAGVGTYYFTVRGTKSGVTLDVPMHITVNQVLSALGGSFALGQSLRSMPIGVPVDDFVTFNTGPTTFGFPPYSWSITAGALPAGLSMDSKGRITGTPTAATNNSYAQPTITITDRAGQTRAFVPGGVNALSVNSTLRAAIRGQFYTVADDGTPTTLDYFSGYLGDGSDGDLVLDGTNAYPSLYTKVGFNYTQIRPVYANSITVGANVHVDVNDYPTFVKTNTDVSAANIQIESNGSPGVGTVAGAGHTSGWFGLISSGGLGPTSLPTGNQNGVQPTPAVNPEAIGTTGNSGNGGGGSGGGAPGAFAGPQTSQLGASFFPLRTALAPFTWHFGTFGGGVSGPSGGAGGGNGTLKGGDGGAGGSGGGVVYWFTQTLTTSASTTANTFSAVGGGGSNGGAAPGAGRGAGGGGSAGAGGIVWLVCVFREGPAVVDLVNVSGGARGLAGATGLGNAGANGSGASSGVAFGFVLSTGVSSSVGIVAATATGGVAKLTF